MYTHICICLHIYDVVRSEKGMQERDENVEETAMQVAMG